MADKERNIHEEVVHIEPSKRLGIVFDIDGTIIAEHQNPYNNFHNRIILRPDIIEFLALCKRRGHSLALWTKGHSTHGYHINHYICKKVNPQHICYGKCRNTFDFVWGGEKLRKRQFPSHRWQSKTMLDFNGAETECKWCEVYSANCQQCTCYTNYRCPCMEIKDLRSIWHSSREECNKFIKSRTLIVENTPQNCIYNYGNAIYVPTFSGFQSDDVFERLRRYIVDVLEPCEDVRYVQKCSHGQHYHPCYEQSWLTDEKYSGSDKIEKEMTEESKIQK